MPSRIRDIDLGKLSAGMRIELTIKKDGVAWNDIDSIAIRLEKPDRETVLSRVMTLSSGNVWYYDLTAADIPDEDTSDGYWTVEVEVTDSTVVVEYPYEIGFNVRRQP